MLVKGMHHLLGEKDLLELQVEETVRCGEREIGLISVTLLRERGQHWGKLVFNLLAWEAGQSPENQHQERTPPWWKPRDALFLTAGPWC